MPEWRQDAKGERSFRLSNAVEREHARNNRVLGRAIDAEFRAMEDQLAETASKEARASIIRKRKSAFKRKFGYQALSNRMEETGQKVSRANLSQYRKSVRRAKLEPDEVREFERELKAADTQRDVRTWRANTITRMRKRTDREFDVLAKQVNDVETSDGIRNTVARRRKQALHNVQVDARTDITDLGRDVTRTRSRAIDLDEFRWQTREDSRVRSSHRALNQKKFRYSEGGDSSEGLPGDAFGCRCRAVPVIKTRRKKKR